MLILNTKTEAKSLRLHRITMKRRNSASSSVTPNSSSAQLRHHPFFHIRFVFQYHLESNPPNDRCLFIYYDSLNVLKDVVEVESTCNILPVSAVQPSDSVTCTRPFFS